MHAKDTLTQLRAADHRAEAELGPLREDYLAARNELADFKEKHRLTGPVRAHARRWTTFGFLFLLVAFESIANGILFAKGSEFGLFGGIGTAIVRATANLSSARRRTLHVQFRQLLRRTAACASLKWPMVMRSTAPRGGLRPNAEETDSSQLRNAAPAPYGARPTINRAGLPESPEHCYIHLKFSVHLVNPG